MTVSPRAELLWKRLGHMDYQEALTVQEGQAAALLRGEGDVQTVYTVEHPPTITIGRNGTMEHVVMPEGALSKMGFSVYQVDRGGDVTYHGPGQLVVYPVLHLGPWNNDVGLYVRMLEEVVIQTLQDVGISGTRSEGYPGVWVHDEKVCAVGARVKRRKTGEFVTSHGLALNIDTDLNHFATIVPCGISDRGVTSINRILGGSYTVWDFESRIRQAFEDVFEVSISSV